MKLVIHAGLHKTATSSFQSNITKINNLLIDEGIYYPTFEQVDGRFAANHFPIIRDLYEDKLNYLDAILSYASSKRDKVRLVLLSGEDFENLLIDHYIYEKIVRICEKHRVSQIETIFVYRDQFEYLLSIYSTMSKHSAHVSLKDMGEVAIRKGYYTYQYPNFDAHYVFDYFHFFEKISKSFSDIDNIFSFVPMEDHVSGYAGKYILSRCGASAKLHSLAASEVGDGEPENVRSSQRDTEERYIQNYFSDSTLKNDKLTDARQKSFELAAKDLKGRFESRFNTYG